ncbi:MAG: V-type ATP synthase subunit D [Thermoplasmata archaeon]|nr:V-type ATP synthase subunit D [Thermoplasmata archaeon]
MPALDVKPTRTELLGIKKKIAISESGYELLKIKMEGLIMNFFKILDEAKVVRKNLTILHEEARQNITIASTVEGALAVKTASFALAKHPEVTLSSRNIMGVTVPIIKGSTVRRKIEERGYGIIGTSPYISDAARSYEKLLEIIIKAAEVETTLKKLLDEIEKTKRRVNALEFRVIPQLKEAERFIELRLEEMERENTFRLKKIKSKREAMAI